MGAPKGPSAARSTSTWIHWWSSVASAKVFTRPWVISCQPVTPRSFPARARSPSRPLTNVVVPPYGVGVLIFVVMSWSSLPSGTQHVPGHDQALDLVGALVDLGDLGVAHHPLDGEVLGEAVAAEQLNGIGRDLHGHVGGVALRCRAEEREVLVAAFGLRGRDVDHLARGFQSHGHVREHELDALEVDD